MSNQASTLPAVDPSTIIPFGGQTTQPQQSALPAVDPSTIIPFGGGSQQPSFFDRTVSALKQEVVDPIVSSVQDAYSGLVTPPQDATEHTIAAIGGGGGALQAYRVAKALVDKGAAAMKAKPEQFKQAAADFQQSIQDFQDHNFMSSVGNFVSGVGGATSLNPTEPQGVGEREREIGQGIKPGGDLVTPLVKSAADLGMMYLGDKVADASSPEAAPSISEDVSLTPKESAVAANTAKSGIAEGAAETVAPTGEDIQPALQSGIRDILNKAADEHGLEQIPENVTVRDAAQNLADQFRARSQATFQNVEKVTGINVTSLKNRISALSDQIDALAISDPEKAGALEQQKLAFENKAEGAFDAARDKGLDVDLARTDWNGNLRANELSQKIRNADDGTIGNPEINPGRLTKPLQKMLDSADGRPGGLEQLLGSDNAKALVQHAENARTATQNIKDFTPSGPTGQQALKQLISDNTGTGLTGKLTGLPQARTLIGMKPSTNWLGVYKDFSNLSSEEIAAKFGSDAPKTAAFIKSQARRQAVGSVVKAGSIAAAAHATGVSSGVFHLLVGE
jgi:hypothetical protein